MNDEVTPSSTLTYGRWNVDANTLPPKAIAYLLSNGFTQSMTDAAAFTKEQKAEAVKDKPEGDHAAILAAMQDEARQKRFDAIMSGSVGVRVGGPRKSPIDRIMQEIVDETLRSLCDAKKVAMPKGDVLKAAREKIFARNEATIREKATARLAESATLADELGDVLGT